MRDKEQEKQYFDNKSTIYGPVKSWRFGMSLGVDPIFQTSTCSFNCIYCQLGHIQKITSKIKVYVPTTQVIEDYQKFLASQKQHDIIMYSGSGEPTLAQNLHEIIREVRNFSPQVPQAILTNGTEIHKPEVRQRLLGLDKIIFKLDATSDEVLQKVNRPASGVSLDQIISGFKSLKSEYEGDIEMQTMLMPINQKELENYVTIVNELRPSLVQLNTPKRPYPLEWHKENRGNHKKLFDYETRELKTLDSDFGHMAKELIEKETGLKVISF